MIYILYIKCYKLFYYVLLYNNITSKNWEGYYIFITALEQYTLNRLNKTIRWH
jgi:hypothetical protein